MKRGARALLLAITAVACTASSALAAQEHELAPDCAPFSSLTGLPGLGGGASSSRLTADAAAEGEAEPHAAAAYRRELRAPALNAMRRARATGPIPVPVHFHVIQQDASTGAVPEAAIQEQMGILQDSFGGLTAATADDSGFEFTLASTDVTINPDWYPLLDDSPEEREMKESLRKGGRRALNVYVTDLEDGLLGWATFPDEYEGDPDMDGVVISTFTVPGVMAWEYGEGDTLTHEAGHWFGLLHTFQGGCDPPGDLVADTPAEADAAYDCVLVLDTCPADPGPDPVDNFMDYAYDACMNKFTAGQGDRMHEQTAAHRNAPPSVPDASASTKPGKAVKVTLAGGDPDGDALTYSVSSAPSHGIVSGAGPALTYRPAKNFSGVDRFKVRVQDVFGVADVVTVRVEVERAKLMLSVKAKRKQGVRRLKVRGGCGDAACSLRVDTRVALKGRAGGKRRTKTFAVGTAKAHARAGKLAKVRAKLARQDRRKITRLLAQGWKGKARANVFAKGDEGGSARRTVRFAVTP